MLLGWRLQTAVTAAVAAGLTGRCGQGFDGRARPRPGSGRSSPDGAGHDGNHDVNTYTCATCGAAVPRHEAALRSVALRQVAYCRPCFEELMTCWWISIVRSRYSMNS